MTYHSRPGRGHWAARRSWRRQVRYARRHGITPVIFSGDGSGPWDYTTWYLAAAAARLVFRYRSELAPAYLAAALAATAAVLHHGHPRAWPVLAAATMVAAAAFLASHRLRLPLPRRGTGRPQWGIRSRGRLGRTAERAYAAAVTVAGGWLTAATALGPGRPPLPAIAVIAAPVAAVPWWAHRRRRAKVTIRRAIEAWPHTSEAAGLPGSKIQSAVVDSWGWSARLKLAAGQTAEDALTRLRAIESALGARRGSVRIHPDPARADRLLLRVIGTDPLAAPARWPGCTGTRSVTQPVHLGIFEDTEEVTVPLLRRHALIGGATGSGKSGLLNVILACLAASSDVVIWGIDLKGGMELQPWAACLDQLATTGGQAEALLRHAVAHLDHRAAKLAAAGQRTWRPSPADPALIIVIDEYAELPGHACQHADSIARRGRAVAVTMLAATQRPTQKAMGHGAARSQMDVRICLRVRERRDGDLILGQGMRAAGWHADTLTAPGTFLISAPEHPAPRPARGYLITDRDITRAAAAAARNRPTLPGLPPPDSGDSETGDGSEDTGGSANSSGDEGSSGTSGDGGATGAGAVDGRNREDQARTLLWAALQIAPEDGASFADLVREAGMGRTWVYYRLREHLSAGRAQRTRHGRWRATPPPSDHYEQSSPFTFTPLSRASAQITREHEHRELPPWTITASDRTGEVARLPGTGAAPPHHETPMHEEVTAMTTTPASTPTVWGRR